MKLLISAALSVTAVSAFANGFVSESKTDLQLITGMHQPGLSVAQLSTGLVAGAPAAARAICETNQLGGTSYVTAYYYGLNPNFVFGNTTYNNSSAQACGYNSTGTLFLAWIQAYWTQDVDFGWVSSTPTYQLQGYRGSMVSLSYRPVKIATCGTDVYVVESTGSDAYVQKYTGSGATLTHAWDASISNFTPNDIMASSSFVYVGGNGGQNDTGPAPCFSVLSPSSGTVYQTFVGDGTDTAVGLAHGANGGVGEYSNTYRNVGMIARNRTNHEVYRFAVNSSNGTFATPSVASYNGNQTGLGLSGTGVYGGVMNSSTGDVFLLGEKVTINGSLTTSHASLERFPFSGSISETTMNPDNPGRDGIAIGSNNRVYVMSDGGTGTYEYLLCPFKFDLTPETSYAYTDFVSTPVSYITGLGVQSSGTSDYLYFNSFRMVSLAGYVCSSRVIFSWTTP